MLSVEQDLSEAFRAVWVTTGVNLVIALAALGLAVAASLSMTRSIADPIVDLADTATQISSGALDRTADVERQDEIGALAQAFNSMTAQLRDLISSLENRVEERTSIGSPPEHRGRSPKRVGDRDLNPLELELRVLELVLVKRCQVHRSILSSRPLLGGEDLGRVLTVRCIRAQVDEALGVSVDHLERFRGQLDDLVLRAGQGLSDRLPDQVNSLLPRDLEPPSHLALLKPAPQTKLA